MLDLSVITNDEKQAVLCKTIEEAKLFYRAVKEQRPDINLIGWACEPYSGRYANKAYILSYNRTRSLKYGDVELLRAKGIEILAFESLLRLDLPEPEVNQTGILSLLGL